MGDGSGFGAALSRHEATAAAVDEVCSAALAQLAASASGASASGASLATADVPDLAVLFASPDHVDAMPDLPARVRARTGARFLVGCTPSGVIGGGAECEDGSALSLWLARLPGATLRPFLLAGQDSPDEAPVEVWSRQLSGAAAPAEAPDAADAPALMLLFADPYSIDAAEVLATVDRTWPGLPVAGGLVSGGGPGEGRLLIQDLAEARGACGLLLAGAGLRFRTIVSQGCRPVGKHMVITRGREHVIHEVGRKPALQAFRDALDDLDDRDKQLAARSLHIGRVIDEHKHAFVRGDFLIRNPVGADFDNGSVMIGDVVRTGQTIQLHVRDADTAEEDLREMLGSAKEDRGPAGGVLLFSCNGRGKGLFGEEGHDSRVIREALGELPIGGFFCAGEFGPVGGRNFIHGYTSTLVVFG